MRMAIPAVCAVQHGCGINSNLRAKASMDTEIKPIKNKELSCGVVPVHFAWGDWQLLILRRGEVWDFPAGIISVHEDALEAAKRETIAATGIDDLEFAFGEDHKETVPNASNKVGRYYVAETRAETITLPIAHKSGKPAHDEWRWVTCDDAEDYLPPRLTHVLEWLRAKINE